MQEYLRIVEKVSEFEVLIETNEATLKQLTTPEIAENIMKMRQKEVEIKPGYDGIFGTIKIKSNKRKS
jgi:PHP family Zn ribbon phosphoesterase